MQMEDKKPPEWFYELSHDIAVKHNLSSELFGFHLEQWEGMYFKMLEDIDNDKET